MVLPVWIEHTTSPLPMECSTTELRQRYETKASRLTPGTGTKCHARRAPASTEPEQFRLAAAQSPALPLQYERAAEGQKRRKFPPLGAPGRRPAGEPEAAKGASAWPRRGGKSGAGISNSRQSPAITQGF